MFTYRRLHNKVSTSAHMDKYIHRNVPRGVCGSDSERDDKQATGFTSGLKVFAPQRVNMKRFGKKISLE